MVEVEQVVIVGTGLLGASLGLALKRRGYTGEILGVGRRPETLAAAKERGAIDRATTCCGAGIVPGALVVLATPLSGFPAAFAALAADGPADLTVTDVGSAKARVLVEAQRLRLGQRFVGAHPMAGSEQQGPEGARHDLFEGKPCIIVAGPDAATPSVALVESLWTSLGMVLLRMTAAEHDRAVAAVSHVPHLVSSLLVHLGASRSALPVASTGFHDATRLASGNPTMWRDIIGWNREEIVRAIDELKLTLTDLGNCIADGRDEKLLDSLTAAKATRDAWIASRSADQPRTDPS